MNDDRIRTIYMRVKPIMTRLGKDDSFHAVCLAIVGWTDLPYQRVFDACLDIE